MHDEPAQLEWPLAVWLWPGCGALAGLWLFQRGAQQLRRSGPPRATAQELELTPTVTESTRAHSYFVLRSTRSFISRKKT